MRRSPTRRLSVSSDFQRFEKITTEELNAVGFAGKVHTWMHISVGLVPPRLQGGVWAWNGRRGKVRAFRRPTPPYPGQCPLFELGLRSKNKWNHSSSADKAGPLSFSASQDIINVGLTITGTKAEGKPFYMGQEIWCRPIVSTCQVHDYRASCHYSELPPGNSEDSLSFNMQAEKSELHVWLGCQSWLTLLDLLSPFILYLCWCWCGASPKMHGWMTFIRRQISPEQVRYLISYYNISLSRWLLEKIEL